MEIRESFISIKQNCMDSLIARLYKSPKTVLTNKDISLLWQETDSLNLNAKIAYYVKRKALIRLTRGVFAKGKDFNPKELATSIYIPSYISFETVLRESGIIFQHYQSIFVASKWPKDIKIGGYDIVFRKLKDIVLFNSTGIICKDNYCIATPERAFLDTVYLFPDYYFDDLRSIDWDKCSDLVKIYDNKQLIGRLDKYRQEYA